MGNGSAKRGEERNFCRKVYVKLTAENVHIQGKHKIANLSPQNAKINTKKIITRAHQTQHDI